jgi:glycosyltransferase involved in cell wall biosynthesis
MENPRVRVAIITNIITTYRKGFFDRLFDRKDIDVRVYCQKKMHGMNLISIHEQYKQNIKIIKFISAKKEMIAWQFLPWCEIVNNYDVVFINGNPRVLSDAVFATFLRAINRKVVLWTMAHSYRNNRITENLRLKWSRIFPNIFVYTDKEVEYLRMKGFRRHFILGMNNGLDQKKIDEIIQSWSAERLEKWKVANRLENRTVILSASRLEPKNKYELLLNSIPDIINVIPSLLLCLIGSGPEEENLKQISKTLRIENHISFVGQIYEEEKLAPYFLSSKLFIHPASVGLSMLHAFGYGLPVITHGTSSLHGPEYGAFIPGLTGKTYVYDDTSSLSRVIVDLLNNHAEREKIKATVQRIAREKYNVDVMVERFVDMVRYTVDPN